MRKNRDKKRKKAEEKKELKREKRPREEKKSKIEKNGWKEKKVWKEKKQIWVSSLEYYRLLYKLLNSTFSIYLFSTLGVAFFF